MQFQPTAIGNYKLIGTINCTGTTLESFEIPIGLCPDDIDNDGIPDNIDIDNDNDGILNCTESYGNQIIDLSDPYSGTIAVGSYAFIGNVTTFGGNATSPISGTSDGTFQSDAPLKTTTNSTSITYDLAFNKPLNLLVEYGNVTSLGNGEIGPAEEFIIRVPNTRTITLLDPDDQLLVDTNYDGVYESGVTLVSAFEIRFKVNGDPLPLGSGTFGFYANSVDTLTFIHKNTSEIESQQATFKLIVTCVARDTDSDGLQDALDLDSDNDAIPDFLEFKGVLQTPSRVDTNGDGLDDAFDINTSAVDTDGDGVVDFYDLDSDNDGIFDWIESGAFDLVQDANMDGMVDGPFGSNGWDDNAETAADSNQIGYTPNDVDGDSIFSYRDLDSDGDGCSDVIEADFSDGNGDNLLGDVPPTVDSNGLVNNASDGYTNPHPDVLIAAPISIDVQPSDISVCEGSDNNISLISSSYDTIQWEVSIDGGVTWNIITDDAIYSASQTNSLLITNTPLVFNNYNYQAFLNSSGNGCGLYSDTIVFTVNALPTINSPVELIQCDDDELSTLGFSFFNLTEANEKISSNVANETFSFYTTQAAAIEGDITSPDYISNPTTYENRIVSNDVVWARIESFFGCSSTAELQLKVSTTSIPSSFLISYNECDDFLDLNGNDTADNNDRDGITTFDFSVADTAIRNLIPDGQNPTPPRYYRNEADALAEENEITNISNYRNIGYPNSQFIYVRIDSEISNDCLGLGPHILLTVEPLPIANPVSISRQCDDDNDGLFPFDTSTIESTVLGTQNPNDVTVSYTDQFGDPLPSPLPNPFLTGTQTITIRVTNNTTADPDGPCYDETTLDFIVDEQPVANPVGPFVVCDGDVGDTDNDGRYPFDTDSVSNIVLGTQTNMVVFYSFTDENGQQITQATTLPDPLISSNQSIQIDVVNPINTTCIVTTILDLVVNPLPEFSVESPQIVCTSDPTFNITLDPNEANTSESFDYEWYFEGNLISTNSILANVNTPGSYTVTLTKTDGTNCTRTRTIIVEASEIAKTTIDDITIVDISENNTVSINTDNIGRGNYEFALQEENNSFLNFQSEPVFTNVRGGFYTLVIRDAICGTIEIPISVVGHPKYFTPNGDGVNDLWQIRGISSNVQPNSLIFIYNRYGKLLKQLLATSPGWDGTFNGSPLPVDDYWFRVQLQDGRTFTGHFALKR